MDKAGKCEGNLLFLLLSILTVSYCRKENNPRITD